MLTLPRTLVSDPRYERLFEEIVLEIFDKNHVRLGMKFLVKSDR